MLDKLISLYETYQDQVLNIVFAFVILIIGLWVIKIILKAIDRIMRRQKWEPSLTGFLHSLLGATLKILLIITVLDRLGVQMTSFIAIIGAAGLAVGLALQGSLANFAGGVLLLIFKPFRVGDFIEAQGYSGIVKSIQIFNTIVTTPDNKTVIIPNGAISNGSITNYSTENTRRVDLLFGIDYGDDIASARSVLQQVVKADARILQNPASTIAVSELGDSSVNLVLRVWVKTADYWDVYFNMQEKVKLAFDAHDLHFPFPQTDIHLKTKPE